LSHLLAVCALVLDDGGSEEEAVAALLHDAAEDHGGAEAIKEIAARFGEPVAGIVALCTDPIDVGDEWRVIKRAHLDILQTAPASVRRVSLAEKLDNARTIVRTLRELGDEMWPRMRVRSDDLLWYYGELSALFARQHPGAMATELSAQLEEMSGLADGGQTR
jgi:(p)ppGpp synthase/HD superfamily hydrolase